LKNTRLDFYIKKPEQKPRTKIQNKPPEQISIQKIQNKVTEQKPRKSLLIPAKIIVKCPKTGETVIAGQKCKWCEHFSHITFIGMFNPQIACKYKPEKEREN